MVQKRTWMFVILLFQVTDLCVFSYEGEPKNEVNSKNEDILNDVQLVLKHVANISFDRC